MRQLLSANGLYDMRFTLYDSAAGGNSVGTPLTNNTVGVTNGLFRVLLDFGSEIFDGSDRWLEREVRTNGSAVSYAMLSPRQAVSAANAASSANTADTLVKRDGGGNFSAGTITANLAGNAASATSAGSFTGPLAGDVTGTQGATVVSSVGGHSAATLARGAAAANATTSASVGDTIVKRDPGGGFSATDTYPLNNVVRHKPHHRWSMISAAAVPMSRGNWRSKIGIFGK